MSLSKILKAAAKTDINKTTQKQMDELVRLRRQRAADSRMSTFKDDVPSAKERALEDNEIQRNSRDSVSTKNFETVWTTG